MTQVIHDRLETSSIGIDAGGSIKEADFRGDDKARHAHDLILWNVLQVR